MKTIISLIFLTLVVLSLTSKADPHTFAPNKKINSENHSTILDKKNHENLVISNGIGTDSNNKELKEYYYPYLHSISPRLGFILDAADLSKGGAIPVILGFTYLSPNYRSPQWEVGADLLTTSIGQISAAKRWIVTPRSSFRPFYKLGMTHKVQPDEQLASFTNFKNYYIEGTVGIEDLLAPPMSIRMDLVLQVGTEDVWVGAIFGYSWAW